MTTVSKKCISLAQNIIFVFLVIYLMSAAVFIENDIVLSKLWRTSSLNSPIFNKRQAFIVISQSAFTPGLRSIMADFMHVKLHDAWHEGRWFRIIPYVESILILQPEWLDGWEIGAWHMSTNIPSAISGSPFLTKEDKKKEINIWMKKAENLLKSGCIINNDSYRLFFYLGWFYFFNIEDYDNAILYFEKAKKRPDHDWHVERLIAHTYKKKGEKKKALKMFRALLADESYHNNSETKMKSLKNNISSLEKELFQ
ncbi:MAG: hypothetical protein KAI43_12220 [Candidatus Aureabacteria bacterium]|nr:hypothetical protein [Candidatus Auribacterota bacterium]